MHNNIATSFDFWYCWVAFALFILLRTVSPALDTFFTFDFVPLRSYVRVYESVLISCDHYCYYYYYCYDCCCKLDYYTFCVFSLSPHIAVFVTRPSRWHDFGGREWRRIQRIHTIQLNSFVGLLSVSHYTIACYTYSTRCVSEWASERDYTAHNTLSHTCTMHGGYEWECMCDGRKQAQTSFLCVVK